MLHTLAAIRIASAICLVALLPLSHAQTSPQPRMNRNAVAVTSVNPAAVNVEKINFAGEAIVNSRVALDPDFNQPSLIVLFDLSNITAVGAQSGTRYVVSSQEYVIQPLAPNQNIDFTFPMTTDVNAPLEMARTGSAHFVLQVDLLTGVVRTNAAVFSAR